MRNEPPEWAIDVKLFVFVGIKNKGLRIRLLIVNYCWTALKKGEHGLAFISFRNRNVANAKKPCGPQHKKIIIIWTTGSWL